MAKQFKFRYANEIAGAFVLLVVLLVIVAALLNGSIRRWFQPVLHVTLLLPTSGSGGLRPGSEVQVLGASVGTVDDVHPSPKDPDRLEAQVSIRGDFIRFVRTGSSAQIRKVLTVAGDSYLEITPGDGAPVKDGAVLDQVESDVAPTDMVQNMIKNLTDQLVPAAQQLHAGIGQISQIVAEARGPLNTMGQTIEQLHTLLEQMQKGQGTAGMLLTDPHAADDVRGILANTRDITARMSTVADQAPEMQARALALEDQFNTLATKLNSLADRAGKLADQADKTTQQVPSLLLQLQATARAAQHAAETLQHSWLLGGSGAQPNTADRIAPDRVDGGNP